MYNLKLGLKCVCWLFEEGWVLWSDFRSGCHYSIGIERCMMLVFVTTVQIRFKIVVLYLLLYHMFQQNSV